MLLPLSTQIHNPELDPDLKDDIAILTGDRAALDALVNAILANKRLAWLIVSGWLRQNNSLVVPAEETRQ